MATLTTAVPSDSPQGQAKKGVPEVTVALPFARASKYHTEQGNVQSGIVINTPVPGTFNFPIPSYGFMTDIYLSVLATGGSGVAAVYFEDAPFSIIQSVALLDVNGANLWGPFSGYSLFLCAKFGGYRLFPPDGSTNQYGGTVPSTGLGGSGALGNNTINFTGTSGNFGAVIPLNIEFGRDGLGSLANNDASARYNLQVQVASATASAGGPIYTTAPTGYPTLSMAVELRARAVPPAQDLFGNQNSIAPPAVGTTQYWSQQTASPLTGAQTLQLTRVGNLIRHHILVFRDSASVGTPRGTAETSDLPGIIQFDWDANLRYVNYVSTQRQQTFQHSGLQVPNGVVWFPYTTDPDTLPFREIGDEWMATVGATKLTLRFTPAASVGLIVLTNDFVATSPDVYAAGALSMGY